MPKSGRIDITDFDDDGLNEILVETQALDAYFAPRIGGAMFELDLKQKGYNLLDTLTRREEGYHRKLSQVHDKSQDEGQSIHERIEAKEKGLEKYLIYDWHRRVSFVDHIMPHQVDLGSFSQNKYHELGDFILEPYKFDTKKGSGKLSIVFTRDGNLYYPRGTYNLTLNKIIEINAREPMIDAKYVLKNKSGSELSFVLGIEFNWSMLAGDSADRYYYIESKELQNNRCNSKGETGNVKEFGLKDEYHKLDINMQLSQACRLWRFPIETVSLSEYGFERVYQSSVTCLCFDIKLAPGDSKEIGLKINFKDI
jgi:hypothetical protein